MKETPPIWFVDRKGNVSAQYLDNMDAILDSIFELWFSEDRY